MFLNLLISDQSNFQLKPKKKTRIELLKKLMGLRNMNSF